MSDAEPADLIPMEDAAERLKVSRATFWRRVKDWGLTVYANPANRRKRLVSWAEVEAAARPRPMTPAEREAPRKARTA
jgi:predicted DNA-binding transcriptional regulator AlpA